MNQEQFKSRTQDFALAAIRYTRSLPRSSEAAILARQFLRSATSVGANYRAACRARSKAEFIAKMQSVLEEADESCYWLELFQKSGLANTTVTQQLLSEAGEITAMSVTTLKTAKRH